MDSEGRLVPIVLAMTDNYSYIFTAFKNMTFKPEVLVGNSENIKMAAREVLGNMI